MRKWEKQVPFRGEARGTAEEADEETKCYGQSGLCQWESGAQSLDRPWKIYVDRQKSKEERADEKEQT